MCGDMEQIFAILKSVVPIVQLNSQYIYASYNDIISDVVNGNIEVPIGDIEKIIQSKLQKEANEIFARVKEVMEKKSVSLVRKVLFDLNSKRNAEYQPETIEELLICESLVKGNVLTYSFNDPKTYVWHRPVLAHAFALIKKDIEIMNNNQK